jgi:hypothetical protein
MTVYRIAVVALTLSLVFNVIAAWNNFQTARILRKTEQLQRENRR